MLVIERKFVNMIEKYVDCVKLCYYGEWERLRKFEEFFKKLDIGVVK